MSDTELITLFLWGCFSIPYLLFFAVTVGSEFREPLTNLLADALAFCARILSWRPKEKPLPEPEPAPTLERRSAGGESTPTAIRG
jgi:hypothetical protein